MQYIIFNVAGKDFGLAVDPIREVLKSPTVTALPECPSFLEGVIHLRGHNVAVMDLRKRFRFSLLKEGGSRHVIMIKVKQMVLGLLVDRVYDLLDIADHLIDKGLDDGGRKFRQPPRAYPRPQIISGDHFVASYRLAPNLVCPVFEEEFKHVANRFRCPRGNKRPRLQFVLNLPSLPIGVLLVLEGFKPALTAQVRVPNDPSRALNALMNPLSFRYACHV